jgi:hypothetical protein
MYRDVQQVFGHCNFFAILHGNSPNFTEITVFFTEITLDITEITIRSSEILSRRKDITLF